MAATSVLWSVSPGVQFIKHAYKHADNYLLLLLLLQYMPMQMGARPYHYCMLRFVLTPVMLRVYVTDLNHS